MPGYNPHSVPPVRLKKGLGDFDICSEPLALLCEFLEYCQISLKWHRPDFHSPKDLDFLRGVSTHWWCFSEQSQQAPPHPHQLLWREQVHKLTGGRPWWTNIKDIVAFIDLGSFSCLWHHLVSYKWPSVQKTQEPEMGNSEESQKVVFYGLSHHKSQQIFTKPASHKWRGKNTSVWFLGCVLAR